MNPVDISLYGIVDPEHCKGRVMDELARISAENGATLIQYRDKISDTRQMIDHANAIAEALSGTGAPFIVNDRVDVALASGAAGVHLGQQDMHVADARRLLGPDAIIGLSIKTLEDAENCPTDVIDYAFIGGVFETRSKTNPTAIGMHGWKERASIISAKSSSLPLGAIAGIDVTNVSEVIAEGCDGIAVISALYMVDDVAMATRELKSKIEEVRS